MFELGIFCVLLLAAGYWAMMWTIGRRDDVLHGKFVEAEPETESEAEPAAAPLPAAPRASAESLQTLLAIIKQDLKEPRRSRPV